MLIFQLLLVQVVLFVGLVVVLRRLMSQHATTATMHLQGLSQDYLRKQEELKKRLEEGERHYQEQLAKATEEAHQLKTRVLQEADTMRQQLIEQARQEAERIIERAVTTQEALKQELTQNVEAKIVERACTLLQESLPETLRHTFHTAWFDELIRNGLSQLDHLTLPEGLQEAQVRSAFPLTQEQREGLRRRLHAKIRHEVTLNETVDPRIVAGVTVAFGSLVLDGSLSYKVREAARHAQGRDRE